MHPSIQNIQNEEYYKLVANNINDLVALYSPTGILEYISPSIYKVLGRTAESLIGTVPDAIVHPADRHFLLGDKNIFSKNGSEAVYFEYRLLHTDGHWIYFDSYRQPVYNAQGNLTNVLAVCRDITKRKKAELALMESEEMFRRLADNILDLVTIFKPDGTRTYVSPSSYSLYGYKPEELMGKHFSDIVHPDDVEKMIYDIKERGLTGEDKFLLEFRARHKNGQWLYCETTLKALTDDEGKLTAFVSTTRNISQWKLAQIALQENEEKYRSLVDSSDAMIAIVSREGKFMFVNDKRADFLQERKEAIIGKNIADFYNEKSTNIFLSWVRKVFEEKTKVVYEDNLAFNGKDYWLRVTIHPVFDSTGNVYTAMVNTIDITGIKYSEDILRRQNDTLKQIAFLQSHIVRSPLTNIQGILYLINEEELNEESRYYFQLLKQAAGKLDDIIKEIVERAVVIRHQARDIQ
jgi:PAS domain S-box-containing protein